MDSYSHILFANSLLTVTSKNIQYNIWSVSPDVDLGDGTLLHRYRTHRISSIPYLYEQLKDYYINLDKDAIVTSIISHIYIDVFNGFVFPYEIHRPVFQNPKIFSKFIQNPFVYPFKTSNYTWMNPSFFNESILLFNQQNFGNSSEHVVYNLISRLSKWAGVNVCEGIEQIVSFTGNTAYRTPYYSDTTIFEEEYSNLVIKYLDI